MQKGDKLSDHERIFLEIFLKLIITHLLIKNDSRLNLAKNGDTIKITNKSAIKPRTTK